MSDTAYRDSTLPVSQRVSDLMGRMTLAEKIGQLTQAYTSEMNAEEALQQIRDGKIGSRILASNALAGSEEQYQTTLDDRNETQRIAVEESRLGIPLIYGRDVIHGHRTVFPIPLGLAAAFDEQLVEDAFSIAAAEAASEAIHWTFAPMIDIARDPRWGRIIEGYGEDPYLCSALAAASVRGLQGDDMSKPNKIAACAKHFAGYGGAEGGRDYGITECTDNTMRNVYLEPFRAAVDAGCATVMSGFHEVGGVPVSGSPYLLTDVLKEEFGFDGFVISDWASVSNLIRQGATEDRKGAAKQAFNAGVDMDMACGCYFDHIEELVNSAEVSMGRLDDAVRRILTIKFQLGLFERPYTPAEQRAEVLLHDDHLAKARKAAAKSMVLLKNEHELLPLTKDQQKLAIIGPYANVTNELLGSWVNDGFAEDTRSILTALQEADTDIDFLTAADDTDSMVKAAQEADLVVLVLGEDPKRSGEAHCVASLALPDNQDQLVKAVAATGKPLVTVVCAARPLEIADVVDASDAVLWAWHPGTEGSRGLVDVLFGDEEPGGRLPVTFPRSLGQVPMHYNRKPNACGIMDYYGIRADQRRDYIDDDGRPLYPFGYGLAYTTFSYDGLHLSADQIQPDGSVTASVTVTNTGKNAGSDVVQLYIRDVVASMIRPFRELKGFQRLELPPGESREVHFELGPKELAFYGEDKSRKVEPGRFEVFVGPNCLTELSAEFEVKA